MQLQSGFATLLRALCGHDSDTVTGTVTGTVMGTLRA